MFLFYSPTTLLLSLLSDDQAEIIGFIDLKHPPLILPRKRNAKFLAWETDFLGGCFQRNTNNPKAMQECELFE